MDDPAQAPSGAQNDLVSEPLQAGAFREAVQQNNIEWLNDNLERDKSLLDITFIYEFSDNKVEETLHVNALALASADGQVSAVNALLEHGASVETEIPTIGGTALHLATRWGGFEVVRLLVEKEADINQADKYGSTPLHLASRFDKLDVVNYLLDMGAQINVKDKEENTPFLHACAGGVLEIAKLLWARGSPSQLYERNIYSNQPIHLAAINDRHNMIPWLLEKGASADELGQNGANALHQACAEGSAETVRAILNHSKTDPSIVHTRNRQQRTPLLVACLNVRPEVVNILTDRYTLVSDTDANQDSCYHQVVMNEDEFSEDHKKVLNYLVGWGADIDQENRQGCSPLVFACKRGKIDLIKSLLDLGASIDGTKGNSPLLEACLLNDTRALETLLEKKPDLSCTNHHGLSPLALACTFGKLHNVKLLIANGADVTARTNTHFTSLCIAAFYNHVETMIEILKTPTYYPSDSLKRGLPDENDSGRLAIENGMLGGFDSSLENVRSIMMENIGYILYWAVRMNCVSVLQKYDECKPEGHRFNNLQGASWLHLASQYGCQEQILEFFSHFSTRDKTRTGATALHLAAVNGTLGTTEFLLNLISTQQTSPHDPIPKIDAILECDNSGESPLALSIKRNSGAHKDLANIFWREFDALGTLDLKGIVPSCTKPKILESLAQYERPGGEKILKSVLEQWSSPNTAVPPDTRTALEWAVESKQSVVVWWLLSKGGHSSRSTMESATRLAQNLEGKVGRLIQDLLKSPPPLLDSVANPNDDQPPAIPEPTHDKEEIPLLTIVDMHEKDAAIKPRYAKASIHDIVYESASAGGLSAIIERAPRTLGLRDLESFKAEVEVAEDEDQKTVGDGIVNLSMDASAVKGDQQQSNSGVEKPKVRWIHLPANKLHLMRDLCTRLSHDSERSEMDHNAMISRFNRGWTELAAGAGHRYMKPHCEHARINTSSPTTGSLGKSNSIDERPKPMSLYMPYLTLGNKSPGQSVRLKDKQNGLNEPVHSRNTRDLTHIPITLDQYYYAVLQDTSVRDGDQVLTRYMEKYHRQFKG
ncbi:hypothetical protein FPOA_00190 [Fusarium poae]|uniref:Uncharacterized protein n=1 Tax=Fusarium poae TaxID=36050 RepID=A0A1B8B0J4_FUSPO|nr:hypothetical protein FPOA_00190 [Fusarium poae]